MEDCATCRFFAPKDEGSGGSGDCRRRAPVVLALTEEVGIGMGGRGTLVVTAWPQVGEAQGCGDWQSGPDFEEVRIAAPLFTYICDHCHDGARVPADETEDFKCPCCGASTMPF